VEAIV
jgi:hypothetical protein